MYATAPVNTRT